MPTPHLVPTAWTELESTPDADGRTVRVSATVTNVGPATYDFASFVPWQLPAGVVQTDAASGLSFGGPIAPGETSAGDWIELYVPTASESAYQTALATGFDGIVRAPEVTVTSTPEKLIDDATLDVVLFRDTDGSLVFESTTAFLDGLVAGDLISATPGGDPTRVVAADCAWFPMRVESVTPDVNGRVRVTPAESTLVFSSGDAGLALDADGRRLFFRQTYAPPPEQDGRRDVALLTDTIDAGYMWDNPDFEGAGPLLRLHVADLQPVPGVTLTGDLLIEKLAAPVALRLREGDVELDAEITLTARFVGSVTAEEGADFSHERALGTIAFELASVPVGVTNLSASVEFELLLDADVQIEAGVTTGVDIRTHQAAVLHLDSGGGSSSRSFREVEVLHATPPRMTEDSHAYASIGVGGDLRLFVSDSYRLASVAYTVGGSGRGEILVDPDAADPVQTGTAVEAHTAFTGSLLLVPIPIADTSWTDSRLAPKGVPLEEPPGGGTPGRGRDQHWATVFDGWGTGRGFATDLAGDHLVTERDGASITTHLASFGRDGQPGWAIQLPDFGGDADALPDGGAVHFASDIIRVDDQGAVQWAWRRPDRSTLFSPNTAVYTHPDGTDDIWTAHRYNVGSKERIARHDPVTGEPVFYEEITADGGLTMWRLLADAHGAVLCGTTNQLSADDTGYKNYGAVMRFDRDGNLLWSRKTSGNARGCAAHEDGSVLLYGSTNPEYYMPRQELFAAEFDLDGNLVWHNTYQLLDDGVPFLDLTDRWSGNHNIDGIDVGAPARDGWMVGGTTGYLTGAAVFTMLVDRDGNPISARVLDGVGVTSIQGLHQRGDGYLLALSTPTPNEMVQSTEDVQIVAMMRHDGHIAFAPEVGLETAGVDVIADHWNGEAGVWGTFTLRNDVLNVSVADAGPWTELTNVRATVESFPPSADGTWSTPCGAPCIPGGDTGDTADTGDSGDPGPGDTGTADSGDTGPADSGPTDTDSGDSDTGGTGTGGDDAPGGDDDGGCKDGCAQGSPAPLWLGLPLLGLIRRRA